MGGEIMNKIDCEYNGYLFPNGERKLKSYMPDCAVCGLGVLKKLRAECPFYRLKQELEGFRAYKRDLDHAFNTGDGSYHP